MTSIVMTAPGQVVVQDVPMPIRKPGETLLRLRYGGICGSDLGSYRGRISTSATRAPSAMNSPPRLWRRIRPGQLVTCNPYFNCGACYSCRRGFVNCCVNNQTMGVQREGAFAEYITVPTERVYSGEGIAP